MLVGVCVCVDVLGIVERGGEGRFTWGVRVRCEWQLSVTRISVSGAAWHCE